MLRSKCTFLNQLFLRSASGQNAQIPTEQTLTALMEIASSVSTVRKFLYHSITRFRKTQREEATDPMAPFKYDRHNKCREEVKVQKCLWKFNGLREDPIFPFRRIFEEFFRNLRGILPVSGFLVDEDPRMRNERVDVEAIARRQYTVADSPTLIIDPVENDVVHRLVDEPNEGHVHVVDRTKQGLLLFLALPHSSGAFLSSPFDQLRNFAALEISLFFPPCHLLLPSSYDFATTESRKSNGPGLIEGCLIHVHRRRFW